MFIIIMNSFAIIVTLFITGAVSGRERVEVKPGEKVLVEKKYGLENLSRLTLYEASLDCNNRDREIFNYCSPEEKKSGCAVKACSTFLIEIGTDSVSLTPLNASDGCYLVRIVVKNSNEKEVGIVVNGELPYTVILDPPPQENPEASSPKGTETPRTDDRSTVGIPVDIPVAIAVSIAVAIAVSIAVAIAVGIAVCIAVACWCRKKKKKNESAASDCKIDLKEMSLIENGINAEQTTGDSSEMGDEDINSLNEVLIHHTSVGQENGRPGQHVHYNDSDDSDFCSNFDEDDDEIKMNNYNDDDGVANGGDDDDGISSGDDNIKNN